MVRGFRFSRLLICVGVSAFSVFAAFCAPELLLISICFAAFMSAAWGYLYSVPPLIAGICTLMSAYAQTPSLYCIAALFFVALNVLSVCMSARVSHRATLLLLTGIFCCGIYVYLTIDSVIECKPPTYQIVENWNSFGKQFIQSAGESNMVTELMGPDFFTEIGSLLPDVLLAMVLLLAETVAVISIFLTRLIFRVFKQQPMRMAPFYRWRLPRSIIGGSIFLIAACIGMGLLRFNAAMPTGLAVGVALGSAYAVQGLSYLFYTYRRTGSPPAVYTCTALGAVVFLPYSLILLVPIGLIEQIGRRRLMFDAAERQRIIEAQLQSRRNEYEKYGYTRDFIIPPSKEDQAENKDKEKSDSDKK